MINKNFYRKTNDKKILHKVGKQWKVISVALLMAIGGGAAVATHANANADSTNGVDTTPYEANQPQFKQPTVTPKAQPQQKQATGVSYYPQASGSAAMYFDRVASDNSVAAKNYNTVNSYVQSLNNEYNPQIHSYSVSSASARNAASNDASLASSFSATVQKPGTTNAINSLASKNHVTPSVYENMIQGNEQSFSAEVKSASADVKANSDVASLVNKLEGTDLSAASLSASVSAGRAESNYYAASYNADSVYARYGEGDNTAASYIDAANKLSADAKVLLAHGNEPGQGYEYGLLTQVGDAEEIGNVTGAAAQASLKSDISGDADEVVNGYKNAFYNSVGNVTNLSDFADIATNSEVQSGADANYYFSDTLTSDNSDLQNEFNNAVSEAANLRMGEFTSSVANSLNANYHGQYADYNAASTEASEAKASASAALRAAGYAYDFADANNNIIDQVSADVGAYTNEGYNSADAKASVAYGYLMAGVNNTAEHFNILDQVNTATHSTSTISNETDFVHKLDSTLTGNQKNLFDDIKGSLDFSGNTADVQNRINLAAAKLNKMVTALNDQYNTGTVGSRNGMLFTSGMISGSTANNHSINGGQFNTVANLLGNSVAENVMKNVVPTGDQTGSIDKVASDIHNNINDLHAVADAVASVSPADGDNFGLDVSIVDNTQSEPTNTIGGVRRYLNALDNGVNGQNRRNDGFIGNYKTLFDAIISNNVNPTTNPSGDLNISLNNTTTTSDVQNEINTAISKLQTAVNALNEQNSVNGVTTKEGINFNTHSDELNNTTANNYTVKTSSDLINDLAQGNNIANDVLKITNVVKNGDNITKTASNISNEINDLKTVANGVSLDWINPNDANAYGLSTDTKTVTPNWEWQKKTVPNTVAGYPNLEWGNPTGTADANNVYFDGTAALLSDGIDMDQLEAESGAIQNVASAANSAAADNQNVSDATTAFDNELNSANSSANSALTNTTNASANDSAANDENVTLASYFASSYTSDASVESTSASAVSVATNKFFKDMANDSTFNKADDAYAGAEAAAANDKKMGEDYSANVFNNSPHFLDVLKNAKLHTIPNFGSNGDKIIGTARKGDRLTVLGVNFNRNGHIHGATRYLVYDNMTKQKGFITGQYQGKMAYTKAAYLSSRLDYNNVDVSVKILKPVAVKDNINGGKTVKTLKPGTVVDGVTIVNDNPSNDAMGFTKVETSDYNFFTANTDYVELNSVVPKNNNNTPEPNNFNFGLGNVGLGIAYNQNGQINK